MVHLTADGWGSWIILVEAAPNGEASLVDIGTVRSLLRAMGDRDGLALYASDRVAVQVQVEAGDVLGALGEALSRWGAAAAESLPAGWHLVRAEVLTPSGVPAARRTSGVARHARRILNRRPSVPLGRPRVERVDASSNPEE